MKRVFFILFIILSAAFNARAQRLVIGEKAPEVRVSEWMNGNAPILGSRAFLVDFFHSSNDQCIANLSKLNALETTYGSRLNIISVSREETDKLRPIVTGKGYGFYIGIDDNGKTFSNYGVRFVPFAALVDARGRLVWTGNIANLTHDMIDKALR